MAEGEALVSDQGFSPRYDIDRWTGLITKPGQKLEGTSICDKICVIPTAKGGIAAGWAFDDIKWKQIAPKALIFGVTNSVMVQGAVLADITITEGCDRHPREVVNTGDWVPINPERKVIEIVRHTSTRAGRTSPTDSQPCSYNRHEQSQ